jgi:2-oxoisovalerate dehydrogenase E2 component (dihydrolipoyl transacylase)
MGIFAFKLPDIGEGVVEGEVVEWMVKVGDVVTEDDPILSVMTDKATVEIPSPVDGKVISQSSGVGEIIAVGSVCIEFEVDGEGNASATPEPTGESDSDSADENSEATSDAEDDGDDEDEVAESEVTTDDEPGPAATPSASTTPKSTGSGANSGKVLASPAVRSAARQAGVDLSAVSGTGPAGRVSKSDLEAHIETAASGGIKISAPGDSKDGITEIPIRGLRRKIAEQMVKSYTTIPHFSYFDEVDVTELELLRQWMNANRNDGQPKLTYLSFIMRALVKAFQNGHGKINSHYDDAAEVMSQHDAVNIGVATQTDRGLYVPVAHHIEGMDIWDIGAEVIRVSSAAREGTATLDELSGSTFTITSLGRDGGTGATPIINAPEVGILGVHSAVERAVVRDGKIVIRRMMNLSSSFDHRVVDGANGAALVQEVKRLLEHPMEIL